jgi:hypothetical protein
MKSSIAPVPAGGLPAGGPRMMITERHAGLTPLSAYRQHVAAPVQCRAGQPLVAIVRIGPLATPDQVAVIRSQRKGSEFRVAVEIRHYDGALFANDPWIALVQVELGPLMPGAYELWVEETTLRFADLGHPETATGPVTVEQRLRFECA